MAGETVGFLLKGGAGCSWGVLRRGPASLSSCPGGEKGAPKALRRQPEPPLPAALVKGTQ